MKVGYIRQELTRTNRWWSDPENWARRDPDLKAALEAPFCYSAKVLRDLTRGGLYVLRGPRRVGKSVELKLAIQELIDNGTDPRSIIYISVEGWSANDLGMLTYAADLLMPPQTHRWWFIDEITSISDGWAQRIKRLRDNDPEFRSGTVVLTGSSSADLRESVGYLAGRRGPALAPDRVMLPIGFRAFASLVRGDRMPDHVGAWPVPDITFNQIKDAALGLAPWLHDLVAAWDAYLWVGGMPSAVAGYINHRQPDRPLRASLREVITGDVFRLARFSDLQTGQLLRLLAHRLGSPLNKSRVAREIDVSPPTAQRRLDDLKDSFVIWPAYREKNTRPQLRAQPKLYFTDPVYASLAPDSHIDATKLSEQQLGMALTRNLERHDSGRYANFDRVMYPPAGQRNEIHFVSPYLDGMAIQSEYSDSEWRNRTARTLRTSTWNGIVATRTELNTDNPNLLALPAAMLAWLIDT